MDWRSDHAAANQPEQGEASGALAALRRFAKPRPATERCELCGAALALEHPHLLNRGSRQIACSCDACAILLCGQENARFVRIPRRILRLVTFSFDERAWNALMLPINLAFFLRQPDGQTTAWYPSPAGPMSSQLELPAWADFTGGHEVLASIEPEVEALLVNRIGDRAAHFIVPLDECYRLVGVIRTTWRGLSGGAEVWQEIADFFSRLESSAARIGESVHA